MPVTSQARKFIIPILIFLLALSLISANLHSRENMSFFESLVVGITSPVQKAVWGVIGGISNIWRGYFYLVGLEKENQVLKRELQELKLEVNRYREAHLANERLRALLNFKKSIATPLLPAQLVAFDPAGWFQTILIDKGRNDGVVRDMAVVSAEGLVGRVIGVSNHHAKVLLILDGNSAVDAYIQRSRARGVLVGLGLELCLLKYVQRNEDVQVGDQVISSGMGGVFPKGLLVGTVKEVVRGSSGLFQRVEVEPAVNFGRLEEVLVVIQSPPEEPAMAGTQKRP
ncbi:MAG: rod shape-determining protein MreC [Deltaproteobacteria bacterium]|nr:MAG: rod shape-determining protein MreC [Deltaproteobacteria bacterium]